MIYHESKDSVNSWVRGRMVDTCDLALSAQAAWADHLWETLARFPFTVLNEEGMSVLALPYFLRMWSRYQDGHRREF